MHLSTASIRARKFEEMFRGVHRTVLSLIAFSQLLSHKPRLLSPCLAIANKEFRSDSKAPKKCEVASGGLPVTQLHAEESLETWRILLHPRSAEGDLLGLESEDMRWMNPLTMDI